jgi:hypothetical protein
MPEKKEKQALSKNLETIIVKQSTPLVPGTREATQLDSQQWISDSAYFKALARGFAPEYKVSDWLEAEKEYETLMSRQWKSGLVRLR